MSLSMPVPMSVPVSVRVAVRVRRRRFSYGRGIGVFGGVVGLLLLRRVISMLLVHALASLTGHSGERLLGLR